MLLLVYMFDHCYDPLLQRTLEEALFLYVKRVESSMLVSTSQRVIYYIDIAHTGIYM